MGSVIQATDPEVARERDARMAANPLVIKTPQPALGAGWHEGGPLAGRVAPQPLLDNGTRFDEGVGDRFVLVASPEAMRSCAGLAHERLVLREAQDVAVRQWLRDVGCEALLLRPDRHVAASASRTVDVVAMVKRYALGEGHA